MTGDKLILQTDQRPPVRLQNIKTLHNSKMLELKSYFNAISTLTEDIWNDIFPFFREEFLSKNEYFIRENEIARKIAFLKSGVVRAYFINNEGKEYNKQFFVGQSIIGAYSSLLTAQKNLIAQHALRV